MVKKSSPQGGCIVPCFKHGCMRTLMQMVENLYGNDVVHENLCGAMEFEI